MHIGWSTRLAAKARQRAANRVTLARAALAMIPRFGGGFFCESGPDRDHPSLGIRLWYTM
jgi:hypothetical protein